MGESLELSIAAPVRARLRVVGVLRVVVPASACWRRDGAARGANHSLQRLVPSRLNRLAAACRAIDASSPSVMAVVVVIQPSLVSCVRRLGFPKVRGKD